MSSDRNGVDTRRRIAITANAAWNLINFREGLIRALVDAGLEVVAIAPSDQHVGRLVALGCRFMPLAMDTTGTNPARDALLLYRYWRILARERPCCLLTYTPKPNIYGSLAARLLSIPVVANVAGLGKAYASRGALNKLVSLLYRLSLKRSATVFFQNQEDLDQFVTEGIVKRQVAHRIPGSGIDLARFSSALPRPREETVFLLIARLLWQKGIKEYVEAARILRARHPRTRFQVLGIMLPASPTAVPQSTLDAWVEEGTIEYLGSADDVRPYLAESDCVVLPTAYREGVPRTLLEAAAMARPVVTSNSPGCRDVVEEGITGFLCQPRDVDDLVRAIEEFLSVPSLRRMEMGERARVKIAAEFDERFVVVNYMGAIGPYIS